MVLTLVVAAVLVSRDAGVGAVVARDALRRGSSRTSAISSIAGTRRPPPGAERRRRCSTSCTRPTTARPGSRSRSSTATRHAGRRGRRRHDRRREGRPRAVARQRVVPAYGMAPERRAPDQPLSWTVNCLVCHTAEIDGVAYFGAGTKTFDELWLGEALKRLTSEPWRACCRGIRRTRAGGRRQPDSEQPSPRQDRFADARAVDGVRGVARRAVHAAARRRDAGGRATSAAAT